MESLRDKTLGAWFGMAVGDALGLSVRGLKPETIVQHFKQMDGFKDIKPLIGKGIKGYRMQGLYGAQSQSALAVCDGLLKSKKAGEAEVHEMFLQLADEGSAGLSQGSPGYLGVFRHSRGMFRRAIESLPDAKPSTALGSDFADGSFLSMAVPIALWHPDSLSAMRSRCLEIGLPMTENLCEITGVVLTGYWTHRFLSWETEQEISLQDAEELLADAAEFCGQTENFFEEQYPELWNRNGEDRSFSQTLRRLGENFRLEEKALLKLICENASSWLKTVVNHPSQGYALALLPLALVMVLRGGKDFESVISRSIGLGRESDKTGVLAGAWAGALYGFSGIPGSLKSGLVNAHEIKARGEALFIRRRPGNLKDLVEMESALTAREFETGKKYAPKPSKKPAQRSVGRLDVWEDDLEDPFIPAKENTANWRKFHKDKARKKRDRRRNLGPEPD